MVHENLKLIFHRARLRKYRESFMEALQEDIWLTTKPWIRLDKGYYWLHTRDDFERWSQQHGTI